ncbi:ATP-dependent DNA helicase RecG [Microlunatus sagamiharensis]|uniref:Probable DNA 3'-5' helicase RecG n=1 Tax=Microlunatus sagamiharensis TaxID=546874 RepID=A0A1H2LUI8_9ACTN|nr:ATP-dependent DNA helicase RecG [Microlunatus sagamiharensis]SDU84673.1 ATP-dependent DNA helicase RecG [Microlunatus sagamiharensis]
MAGRSRTGRSGAEASATDVRPADAAWRTPTFRRLDARLDTVVGGRTATQLEGLRVRTVGDLLHLVPRRYFAGTELSDLSTLEPDEEVAVLAEVRSVRAHNLPSAGQHTGRKPRLEVVVTDRRGYLTLTFFGAPHLIRYWEKDLRVGARGLFAGKVRIFNNAFQLSHPDFVILGDDGAVIGGAARNEDMAAIAGSALVPIYPQTGKLRTWTIGSCVGLALGSVEGLPDPLPDSVREAAGVVDLGSALRGVHQPTTRDEQHRGLDRLRFDEAFALQLTMARRRADAAAHGAIARPRRPGGLLEAFDARLPFRLTAGQQEIGEELFAELAGTAPMQRLLQGEVGSGKTLVALRAMLAVVDAGGQAALLAPTEVLAAQHRQTIARMLGDLAEGGTLGAAEHSTDVVLLTGSLPAARRRDALARVASGEAGLVVGTHALLSEDVAFADLGLVVVDEQHRFGVEQRAALGAKAVAGSGARPHVLVMTATPIPRSVAMTVFGDLETSTLSELPAGRAEVSTVVVDVRRQPAWVDRAWHRVREEVAAGHQAYVVCARISSTPPPSAAARARALEEGDEAGFEPEDAPPAVAVEDLYAELSAGPLDGLAVEMLHGGLPSEEKDAVMARFAAGETDVLVATTVIEVGVDVPNATVMVICDADRFGISQLHQLRGRIGRGGHTGVCLLLTTAVPGTPARDRLDAVASTRDGFALAEVDLEQRREGDVLGSSQSGRRSSLRLLRVLDDADLIDAARGLAERCVADPELADHPGLADVVTDVERKAAGDWLERT